MQQAPASSISKGTFQTNAPCLPGDESGSPSSLSMAPSSDPQKSLKFENRLMEPNL